MNVTTCTAGSAVDYDPYEWVCVEWAERDKTERDRMFENTGDWIDKLGPDDTPTLRMMGVE